MTSASRPDWHAKAAKLYAGGLSITTIAARFGVSRATVRRALNALAKATEAAA